MLPVMIEYNLVGSVEVYAEWFWREIKLKAVPYLPVLRRGD